MIHVQKLHVINFLVGTTKIQNLSLKRNQQSDKDKEISCHQLSFPIAASHCPVTQMSPLNFVVMVVARAVAWHW